MTEGGTLVPAIWSYSGLPGGQTNDVIADVRDVSATLLALADIPETDKVAGRSVAPIEGSNLNPYLQSGRNERPLAMTANEFYGQATVRWGKWKLLRLNPPAGDGSWHLFDTLADPAERRDMSGEQPGLVREMKVAWERYSQAHNLSFTQPDK